MNIKKKSPLLILAFYWIFHVPTFAYAPKIYDCFIFYNELELLEIKLNELYNHLDYFVLVESAESFRGKQKPLYFAENKYRFSRFLDKIIHVIVTEHLETDNPWDREFYQRNQILRGLTNCNDEDVVIIEDLDEIVRAAKLPEITKALFEGGLSYVICDQTIYTYFLNRYGYNHPDFTLTHWPGSVVARYAHVKLKTPQGIRFSRGGIDYLPNVGWRFSHAGGVAAIANAGWHFTNMGGVDRVVKKIENFSHSECDNEPYKDPQRILREAERLKVVEIDETYPQFVRDNIPYFVELGFIDPTPTESLKTSQAN